ncbi:hypothetical protein [Ovoidimarina sediminis]|uniref:hypothetical protein n=1 Tax=Ovoidimarina sediminis TaxID=3079856 RepID=UPI002914A2A6|nr:hypothetical protein [Rhodophyticola sp. MJ-SS7]MDU8942604.1 hypothetical protein [Rhodophyticola sp. MJ-SS7]
MSGRDSTNMLIGGAIVLALVGIGMLIRSSERDLIQSATGFEGLRYQLLASGVPARTFRGGYPLDPSEIGLRVLPLYDLEPGTYRAPPQTRDALLKQEDERNTDWQIVARKAETIPTVIVLPKWQSSVRLSGTAHSDFLNTPLRAELLLQRMLGKEARLRTDQGGFVTIPSDYGTAEIYLPRSFTAPGCTPLIEAPAPRVGPGPAMIAGRCTVTLGDESDWQAEAIVVSDPDLLNTHGLRLGGTAEVAAGLLKDLSGGQDILIDYSEGFWTRSGDTAEATPRTWSDFLALFGRPFAVLWLGLVIAAVLSLWRAGVRFGPPIRPFRDGPGAARSVSVEAQARLLRLTGDTPALLRAYADARLLRLAERVFGLKAGASERALWAFLERQKPEAARDLRASAAALRSGSGAGAAAERIERFERDIEQVTHDVR